MSNGQQEVSQDQPEIAANDQHQATAQDQLQVVAQNEHEIAFPSCQSCLHLSCTVASAVAFENGPHSANSRR